MIEVLAKENIEDPAAGGGHTVMELKKFDEITKEGIYAIEKYNTCNNNSFAFYMTDNISGNGSGEIKPVKFKDIENTNNSIDPDKWEYKKDFRETNEIDSYKDGMTFYENYFDYAAYNNSTQEQEGNGYQWDNKKNISKRFFYNKPNLIKGPPKQGPLITIQKFLIKSSIATP